MKHPITEQHLSRGKFNYIYRADIPISEIDLKTSLDNPARLLKRLDEQRVEAYTLAMIDGVKFPAIVLLRREPPTPFKYDIATGCHRVEAAIQAELKTFDAYIVTEPDAYRREFLIRSLNTIEGHGVSVEDRYRQVIELYKKWPDKSLTQMAKEWNLREKTLKYHFTLDQALQRGLRLGIDLARTKVANNAILALNTIHSEVTFEHASRFASSPGVRTSEIIDMVKEVKEGRRDETSESAVIIKYEQAHEREEQMTRAKSARIGPAPANKLIGNARKIINQVDRGLDYLHLSALGDLETSQMVFEDAIIVLKRVIEEMERIRRLREQGQSPRPPLHPAVH